MYSFYYGLCTNRDSCSRLEQLLLPPQISKGPDIRQSEIKPELVLIPYRPQRKPAIFNAEPATIPVVSDLRRRVLQKSKVGVEPQIRCSAESRLIRVPIAKQNSKLVKCACRRRRRRGRLLTRRLQVRIPATNREFPKPIVHKCCAGADSPLLDVVIQIPFSLGPGRGLNAQPRDDRRKSPRIRQESNPGEVGGGGQHIALPRRQSTTKRRISKILLSQFPGENLLHLRPTLTGHFLRLLPFPRDTARRRGTADNQRRHPSRATIFLPLTGALGIKAIYQSIFDFVGIAQQVPPVKA